MYLNCHTYYSFKYGTLSPEQLLEEALRKGITTLALTDINNTSGILDFFRLAPKYNVKPVAGIDFRNGAEQKFIGLAKSIEGFKELNDYMSKVLADKKKFNDLVPLFNDVFVIYPFRNASRNLREDEYIGIKPTDFNKLLFSELKYLRNKLVILQPVTFLEKDTREINGKEVTFHKRHIYEAHRLLRAMDNNTILSKLREEDLADIDEVMLPEDILRNIFLGYPFMVEKTNYIFNNCRKIDFEFGQNKNKNNFHGSTAEDVEMLKRECEKGMVYRYGNPDKIIRARYEKELGMIKEREFTGYFLINWDIVQYAWHKNFSYVGRGSGANSMVAYLLKITDVDPIDLDLYFERFINPSRKNPPDFDIDFSSDERDKIIEYIFDKYGKEHTALLATYSTLKENAVVRELGKVLGLPKAEIDSLDMNQNPADLITKKVIAYSHYLMDFPSHLSIHAGGILISEEPIHCYTATNIPPKGFPLTQFSMLEAEDVGLYKFDILAQRGLGKIRDAVDIIRRNRNKEIDIHEVSEFKEDVNVRENLRSANLIGCFYVESPAMRMLLTKLKAQTYLDLVAASSIIRPGVAQSGMMREYILRFHEPERRKYAHPMLQKLMEETFGVMVYQEDVIKVAHEFAGLSLEDSDKLRRGMGGKYKGREEFKQVENKFFANCREIGYDEALIAEVWRQMESFGGYAFAKGHSASYAVESYQCMFLKTYYPLEYLVAVINNGGGFYSVEFYVNEARKCRGIIHAPDINKSEVQTVIYDQDIYLGFQHIKDLEKEIAATIVQERIKNGEYQSFNDFLSRVSISLDQARMLIRIGAFRFTGRTKQRLHWDMHMRLGSKRKTTVSHDLFPVPVKKFKLPELFYNKIDDAWDESEILDFFLCSSFDLLKTPTPEGKGIMLEFAFDLKKYKGKIVSIIGQLVTRKVTSTKRGQVMSFGTFLDKKGDWIDTTHFPHEFSNYPFYGKGCYLITGKVVEEFDFYSIEVTEMRKLEYLTRDDLTAAAG